MRHLTAIAGRGRHLFLHSTAVLALSAAGVGGAVAPASGSPPASAAASVMRSVVAGVPGSAVGPRTAERPGSGQRWTGRFMCHPEPPDYPGCTPRQVRPLLRLAFWREYTGHAAGYRYRRMGQHHRGVIFAHLRPALNAKMARLYRAAVYRYTAEHTAAVTDKSGHRFVAVTHPRYRTWAGFKRHATALCTANDMTHRFPVRYCWAITKIGQAGQVVADMFRSTTRIILSCDGYAAGGFASGGFAAWRLGTGILAGGFYGAVGVEIGCQTTHLWNWVTNLW